jgi:outer membrane protein assembly factor BamE (lipoprotein component of BamABCDE complex)
MKQLLVIFAALGFLGSAVAADKKDEKKADAKKAEAKKDEKKAEAKK